MRTISKIFWAILQHISAPSEKEIRERLLALLLVFLIWAPALALTPDEMRGEAQRQYDRYIELEIDRLYYKLQGSIVYTKETDSFKGEVTIEKGDFPEEAFRPAIEKLERQSWIVTMRIETNSLFFVITERKK